MPKSDANEDRDIIEKLMMSNSSSGAPQRTIEEELMLQNNASRLRIEESHAQCEALTQSNLRIFELLNARDKRSSDLR